MWDTHLKSGTIVRIEHLLISNSPWMTAIIERKIHEIEVMKDTGSRTYGKLNHKRDTEKHRSSFGRSK